MSGYKFDKKELQPARQTVIVLKEITAKKLFEPGHVGTSVILAHFRLEWQYYRFNHTDLLTKAKRLRDYYQ